MVRITVPVRMDSEAVGAAGAIRSIGGLWNQPGQRVLAATLGLNLRSRGLGLALAVSQGRHQCPK
jgi:hypothetical protein